MQVATAAMGSISLQLASHQKQHGEPRKTANSSFKRLLLQSVSSNYHISLCHFSPYVNPLLSEAHGSRGRGGDVQQGRATIPAVGGQYSQGVTTAC